MKTADPLLRILKKLLRYNSIPRSEIGSYSRRRLETLFQAGALAEERSGGGWRIAVKNRQAVSNFADNTFPLGLDHTLAADARSEAVAALRSAKRGSNQHGEALLIRAFTSAELEIGGTHIDLMKLTSTCGIAAFLLGPDTRPVYNGKKVALVENLEPFLRFEKVFNNFDAAIYTSGRMSERLLNWLAKQSFEITHFGDYDPVGLQEYLRLHAYCSKRAKLYVPSNFRNLLEKYGNPILIRKSSAILANLRLSDNPEIRGILKLIDDNGLGLEQEILWADAAS
jgi:hypothetical protein